MIHKVNLPQNHSVVFVEFESGEIDKCYYEDGYFKVGSTGMNWSNGSNIVKWYYQKQLKEIFDTGHFNDEIKSGSYSEEYLKWVKDADLPELTNTQHKFAEWLLSKEISKRINVIGSLDDVFKSVRKYLRDNYIKK